MRDHSRVTHFGFESVDVEDKTSRVRAVFDSVADRYDVMNDLMSFGVHRLWKGFAMLVSTVRRGDVVLDLAAGTGDLTRALAARVGSDGRVVSADINARMLNEGRARCIDRGVVGNVDYALCNAEKLPFAPRSFDAVTIAFGLRNVTHKEAALAAMCDALRPGGQLLVLEFSAVANPLLRKVYDLYSFNALPWLGERIADDGDSYRYLAESIRMHPNQDTLLAMLETAGFERCSYLNLSGGVVAIHRGYRL